MHILAPQELEPQLDGDFRLLDSETGVPVEITADDDLLRRYQANLTAWRSEVEAYCNARGIIYFAADSSVPVEEFVLAQMRQRGVLR